MTSSIGGRPSPTIDRVSVRARSEHADAIDRIWRIALRTALSLALVIAAAFPAFDDSHDHAVTLWGFANAFAHEDLQGGQVAFGWFVVAWTLGTLLVVGATLLVPPSMLGRRVRTAISVVLGCFAAGHLLLVFAANDDAHVRASYGWSIAAAAVLCALWGAARREAEFD